MSIAAVICEYNPFHTGHKYQFEKIREELGVDYIICLMSGDFVQRGEPAIYSKEIRARHALENGADAVFLLPLSYACGSADLFSLGAVYILNKLNCVDYLCFGSECGDITLLKECAQKLMTEGSVESPAIQRLLKEGNTYPKARCILFPEYEFILNQPNNVLALEYIMAINRLHSNIVPYTLKREGQSYEDAAFDENAEFLSATALRKAILTGGGTSAKKFLPYDFLSIMERPIGPNAVSGVLFYSLITQQDNYSSILELSPDLADRIKNLLPTFKNFTTFTEEVKSRNYTYSRVSRSLLHIMLRLQGSSVFHKERLFKLTGIRLLGFKEASSALLTKISDSSGLTIISKVPAVYDDLDAATKEMLDEELFASTLYDKNKGIETPEYSKQLIIVKEK